MADATATANQTEKVPSDVQIEQTGPVARRLTITVAPETIAEKIGDAMDTLSAETALPGFRKGRAPKALLERRFGTTLREETRNQIVAGAYATAIEEHGLQPVGDPEPVEKMEDLVVEEGKPLTFSVDIEVLPDFELPAFDAIEVKKPVLDITDEHIGNELEKYQRHLGDRHKVDGDFEAGDRLLGRARVTRQGEEEPFFDHDQVVVVHPGAENGGQGQVLGLLVDRLDQRLAGTKVTDTITIETTAPEGHEREDVRGKDLVIEFEINQAERIKPVSVGRVVETLGLGTEQILREQVRMTLEQRRDEEQAAAMRQQAAEFLINKVDFELPEKLSERQVTRTLERQRMELLYEGLDPEEVESRLAETRADSITAVRNRLKLFFLLRRLADKLDVEVTEQEINGRVASMAARRGVRPEQMANELMQSGRLAEVASQIRENKALDRVIQQAKVTEITAEEWRKIHEGPGAAGGPKPAAKKTTTKKKTTKKKTAKKAATK